VSEDNQAATQPAKPRRSRNSAIWIAELRISAATAQKVARRHNLYAADIQEALVCRPGLVFTWHDHPTRGRRAIVEARVRGHRVLAVLYPVADAVGDVWRLGSAYRIKS